MGDAVNSNAIRFGNRTSEKRFPTENPLENDDPYINPLYPTGELGVEIWVVSAVAISYRGACCRFAYANRENAA